MDKKPKVVSWTYFFSKDAKYKYIVFTTAPDRQNVETAHGVYDTYLEAMSNASELDNRHSKKNWYLFGKAYIVALPYYQSK